MKYDGKLELSLLLLSVFDLAKEMSEANRCGEQLNLTDDELAFYDALEVNDSAVKVLGRRFFQIKFFKTLML